MQTKNPALALSSLVCTVVLATTLAACGSVPPADPGSATTPTSSASSGSGSGTAQSTPTTAEPAPAKAVTLTSNVDDDEKLVKVDTIVKVKADSGTVSAVKLWTKGPDGDGGTKKVAVDGKLSDTGTTWTAAAALDPGSKYRLEMKGVNTAGKAAAKKVSFTTASLSLDRQTYATILPAKGSTVGVGMPVILNFDIGIEDRKEFEKNLQVTSTGSQEGTWRWYGDKSVHFRPKTYWKKGTKVKVLANLNGVNAGNGIYGQKSVSTSFTVGRSVVTKVNLKTHKAKVYVDGKLKRTIPVSGGKSGWQSRSGTKLIMQKLRVTRMTNEAIGASEEYDFRVPFAMRVTNSGEFLHAAPWKEGKGHFGRRNSSHGCVGMSTANARWLYNTVRLGDPVITTGTGRGLEQGNGWSDWDLSYQKYKKGSAL